MKDPKRLHSRHLRLVITLAVDLLTLAETLAISLHFLRPWLLNDRRARPFHALDDRRRTWLQKLETNLGIHPPSARRDWRIIIMLIVAALQVLVITIATATVHPESILIIPALCIYAALALTWRRYLLQNLAS